MQHPTSFDTNPAALKTHWAEIFTSDFIAELRSDVPHEMFVHEGEVMLGHGELWFDAGGLVVVNPVLGTDNSKP